MWFLLCGYNASIPIEPALYDLLVAMPDGIKRVQVKTTTFNNRGWLVRVGRRSYSVGNRAPLVPYDPDLIDLFFILDGSRYVRDPQPGDRRACRNSLEQLFRVRRGQRGVSHEGLERCRLTAARWARG